jgi:hypothetical protein
MNWTEQDLQKLGYHQHHDGNYYPNPPQPRGLLNALVKHAPKRSLDKVLKTKENSTDCIAKCNPKYHLTITRYSTRTLDVDNFAGGCKPLIDQIRYAKLIPDDNPESVEIIFKQAKVKKIQEQRTEVQIIQR